MEHFANIYNEDVEKWGVIGLLHDMDYELYPNEHCIKCVELLKNHDIPDSYIRAIVSHGYDMCTDVKPDSIMEKLLYTCDELTGLITAIALMKPNKSLAEVDVLSVNKKWNKKGFASGVNREVIETGAKMLELDLDYIIQETLNGMSSVSSQLGL